MGIKVSQTWSLAAGLALLAAACTPLRQTEVHDDEARAVADVQSYAPSRVRGTVRFSHDPMTGLRITGTIRGLYPGNTYALHIHESGNCDSEETSGQIFDPGNSRSHGAPGMSPGKTQAGTLPNIIAGNDSTAQLDFTTTSLGAENSPFSVIGRSVVIHASPDDFQTQPEGNAGAVIACGIIRNTGAERVEPAGQEEQQDGLF